MIVGFYVLVKNRVYSPFPNTGDLLIFTTNFRLIKGIKGYYRVNMKHGVVRSIVMNDIL